MAPDFEGTNVQIPPPSNWALEKGYTPTTNIEPYPYHIYGSGKHSNLFIILKSFHNDISYPCSGPVHGFKIIFDSPNEQPQLWKSFFYISPNRAALFEISPKLTVNSPDLVGYSPNTRQCFFSFERKLRFFKVNSWAQGGTLH